MFDRPIMSFLFPINPSIDRLLFQFTLATFPFISNRLFGCLRASLLVVHNISFAEEASKENKVGCVHEEGDFNVVVGDVTLIASLFHLVGPDVHHCSHHHLGQLSCGDAHGNPARNPELEGLEGVVAVHGTVDKVVHADKPTGSGNVVGVRVPSIEEDSDVVVPVEEDEWLLPENDEHCVAQLRHLAQREHPVPESTHTVVKEAARKQCSLKAVVGKIENTYILEKKNSIGSMS